MDQLRWEPLHPPPPPSPSPPPLPAAVAFSGDRGAFFRLVSRGAGLELITVGFYRFWLATDIRRHLWSNTLIDGDAAEYTGRGRELLIGFLFALAILVPVYLAYFLVGLEVERFRAFASFPLLAFFYVFGQFAVYRARRYRLTRTVWRGVRFWMDGSGWAYAGRATLWGLLVLLTLGLALPWREAALERYKMQHSYYGGLPGDFDGRGWEFFKQGWWIWFAGIALLAALALTKWIPPAPLLAVVAAPFLYATFKAIEWRWWVSGIRFGGVQFESKLESSALAGLYWKVIGWFLLFSIVFPLYMLLCAALVAGASRTDIAKLFMSGHAQQSIPMIVLGLLGYLLLILALNVVMRLYLMRDVWSRVAATTTVYNIAAAENVTAIGDLASALGEGFADGLDVAGF
ncbi:DUF898 family protein [Bradyrhizobium sp. NP1]|uniref:DUF898 family protein n=1 Tax=Bradyrhizobium sp. NP1 TaxID=3049772 RepID=UPI0025A4CE45|nr:DUF898 family protein [Bradyrhizobium sp. NP1]WJR77363.1 DUF898 family protein [Bradyrhizobium sp. NP1]